MKNSTRTLSPWALLAVALLSNACGGEAAVRVHGTVTDDGGSQFARFGGEGTLAAASTVRVEQVASDGSTDVLAEVDVQADGRYAFDLDPELEKLVITSFDAEGQALASAILDTTGEPGGEIEARPMDTESSVEAAIFLEMVTQGVPVAEANTVDLRARVDAEVAAAVHADAAQDQDQADADVAALAEAIAAAQAAEVEAYGRQGLTVTQSDLFALETDASLALDAALAAGEGAEQSYEDFFAALADAATAAGADAQSQAEAEAQASFTMRLTLDARATGEGTVSDAVIDRASIAAASAEARATSVAVQALLDAGGAAGATLDGAEQAATALRASVSAATTAEAAASAFASYEAALVGSSSVQGSVLGTYLGVDTTTAISVDAAVSAAADAAVQLDAAAQTGVDAAVGSTGSVDPEAAATAVTAAWSTYAASVHAYTQTALSATWPDDVGASASILIVATGSFRGR